MIDKPGIKINDSYNTGHCKFLGEIYKKFMEFGGNTIVLMAGDSIFDLKNTKICHFIISDDKINFIDFSFGNKKKTAHCLLCDIISLLVKHNNCSDIKSILNIKTNICSFLTRNREIILYDILAAFNI